MLLGRVGHQVIYDFNTGRFSGYSSQDLFNLWVKYKNDH